MVLPRPPGETPPDDRPDWLLLDLLRKGDRAASGELYRRYAGRLRDLAARHLPGGLFEPEDVVQSAFRTFLAAAGRSRYDVPDGQDLWALLVVVTLNKVRSYARYSAAGKRSPVGTAVDVTQTPAPAFCTDPTRFLAVGEALDQFPPDERELIELRVAGHPVDEIAARLGRSKRTVERVLQSCRIRLLSQVSEHD